MKSASIKLSKKFAFIMGVSLISLGAGASFAQEAKPKSETVTVLGSRIKRINKEGPAPVTTIDAAAIKAGGYASIPDVLKSVTQNSGATLSEQDFGGGIMTPGASQVNLRGLGPNHTLVMVNGHRVADFPMPFNGLSNFADVSNIPVSMVDKIEVLSGSASAIYGSDAVAGVMNFTLKDKADGTSASYKYGITEQGDGQSHLATLSTGFNTDKFKLVFGAEYYKKDPIWQFDRAIQDSRADAPTPESRNAVLNFYRSGGDATAADCNAVKNLAGGTMVLFTDTDGDTYCGSQKAISYGTITSDKSSFNTYTSMKYDLGNDKSLYANLQAGIAKTKLMNDVTYWRYQDENGQLQWFYNQDPSYDDWDKWRRIFTPEEAGGIEKFMTSNKSNTVSFNTGLKGVAAGTWNYDLGFNYSRYNSTISSPQTVAAKANKLFLGDILDVVDGEPTISAPLSNFYRALTPAQWDSITERVITKAYSQTQGVSLVVTKDELFKLPAGPVSVALVGEVDNQSYSVKPNEKATDFGYYYGYAATSGAGERDHRAAGVELKLPLLDSLEANVASRYDSYSFGDNDIGKVTYNAGLEYRPVKSLLVRAAYGTGFRAPDLHYVFANLDLFHPSVTDYYNCRVYEAGDCSDYADLDILKHREGSTKLRPETSKSYNIGFVYQPTRNFDFSVDYFNVAMRDQVQDLSTDQLLRDEADCRLGVTESGKTVNASSPTCIDALKRVFRDSNGDITHVYINPINVAREDTDGLDISVNYTLPVSYGKYRFSINHTEVFNHTSVQYVGDAELDQLAVDSGYTIPSQKTTASVTFEKGPYAFTLTGKRLGKLQNYAEDAWTGESYLFNANVNWNVNDKTEVSFSVNNLLDTNPKKDPTWTGYPYYNSKWFDSIGRAYFIEVSHKF
ncbi:MAG: TonB-dependent receptor [Proteobacteria bacterium]|nr:TonB-dependent receptor [Pseudomonadota bacterium]